MFRNMSVRQRLGFGFGAIIVLMIGITLIGLQRVTVINQSLSSSADASAMQRFAINFRGSVHDRAISIRDAVITENNSELRSHLAEIERLKAFYAESDAPMQAMLTDAGPTENRLYQAIGDIQQRTLTLSEQLIGMRQSGEMEQARQFLLQQVSPAYSQWLAAINEFIDHQEAALAADRSRIENVAEGFVGMMILITLAALVLSIVLAVAMVRYFRRSLGAEPDELRQHALAFAAGNLNTELSSEVPAGSVMDAFARSQANTRFAIDEANNALDAIGRGDFSSRIESELPGDLARLKNGVNKAAESVDFSMDELAKVMRGLYDGDFSVRMDNRIQGRMRKSVESALEAMQQTFAGIAEAMQHMEAGDYGYRVEVDARGDLENLKARVNNSLDSLERGIDGLTHSISALAKGDLSQPMTGEYSGEMRLLQNRFNQALDGLQELIVDTIDTVEEVSTSASEVASGSNDLNDRTQRQSASLEETAASMEEMTSTVSQSRDSAKRAEQHAKQALKKAEDGHDVMQKSSAAMHRIRGASERINEITSLIDGIAFQTNLLALNAAVEAARAGEQGRGFAVVASEVRNLAQKAAEAAKEISSLIENASGEIREGVTLTERSSQSMTEIFDAMTEVRSMISEIAEASSEQASGIEQVNGAIVQMDDITQQNAALVEQTSSAAENMAEAVRSLSVRMKRFTVRRKPSSEMQGQAPRLLKAS